MNTLAERLGAERQARLHAAMAKEGIEVLFVVGNPWRNDYLRYACGVALSEGQAVAVVDPKERNVLIVETPAEAARIAAEQPGLDVHFAPSAIAAANDLVGKMSGRKIGMAPRPAVPYLLARGEAGASVARSTAMLDRLMLVKSPAELEAVRKAAALADEGYRVFMSAIRVGRPEYELVADVEAYFREKGCPDNFQLLGSGGRELRAMRPPNEKRLALGDIVGTEVTPCVEGYYAQICRTLVVGPASEVQKRAFAVYNEAMEAGIASVRPGVTAGQVARAENEVFRRRGLGDYVTSEYTRVRGHGLGLYVDSKPSILEDVDMVLEPGMTLVVHPNTYHPDTGYILHGESLRVTDTGCEVYCRTPRELFSVGV